MGEDCPRWSFGVASVGSHSEWSNLVGFTSRGEASWQRKPEDSSPGTSRRCRAIVEERKPSSYRSCWSVRRKWWCGQDHTSAIVAQKYRRSINTGTILWCYSGTGECGDAAMMKQIQMDSPFNITAWQSYARARIKVVPVTLQPPENRGPGCFAMTIAVSLLYFLTAPSLKAQAEAIHKMIEPKPNVAAASLSSYLERVRAENSNIQAVPGSIWTDSGRLTRMSTDVRAMRPHDLISVVVSETLPASPDHTVKNSRASTPT